jgi:hypothetical protein
VFGQFWDTAATAINGTRNLLLSRIKHFTDAEQAVAHHWLRTHPVNSLIEAHRSITLLRDVGVPYCGQLTLQHFKGEFLLFARQTLTFQSISRLVHGDIHEGNIRFQLIHGTANFSSRLNLIDWDEALPRKPCHRLICTDRDRSRYPNDLVDFPELYTKYQLLNAFHYYWSNYYISVEDSMVENHQNDWHNWVENAATVPGQELRRRAVVDAKFQDLCKCLES